MADAGPLGVTLIGGFLGAGKTTLLSHILSAPDARRIGVLVNDFGDLPVDAAVVTELRGDVMHLGNGCICCSIQGDLMRALFALKDGGAVDHVIIETSGVSDLEVLAVELIELEKGGLLRLDAILGLVDAEHFPRLLAEHPTLGKAQVRAADLVLLNKVDLVTEAEAAAVEAQVRALAPRARVVRTVDARVPLAVISGARADDPRALEATPGAHDHAGPHDHAEHAEHAATFSAWTYREARPLTWMKLGPLLAALPEGVFRAKGTVQIVERPGKRVLVHVVGARVHVRTVDEAVSATELVFIGTRAAERGAELAEKLGDCVA